MTKKEIPENSDLLTAIKIAENVRDEALETFTEKIKNGALDEDKAFLQDRLDALLKMNENIKVLNDAITVVYSNK